MHPLIALVVFISPLALFATPQEAAKPDPVDLLRATARAMRSAPGLSFAFEKRTLAADGTVSGELRARGTVSAASATQPLLATLDAAADAAGQALALRIDGEVVRVLDPRTKTLWSSHLHRAGMFLVELHGSSAIGALTSPDTFDEFVMYAPRVVGREDIGGISCNVLAMALPDGTEYRTYLGVDDALPRRMSQPKDGGRVESTWTDLRVLARRIEPPTGPVLAPGFEEREFSLGGPTPGTEAPLWKAVDRGGHEIALEGFLDKVVVLDFWATWCSPCVASMPGVQKIYDEFKGRGLVVIGARWMDDADPAPLLKKLGITYPIIDGSAMADAYGVSRSGVPTLFVIGRDGKVIDYMIGFQGASTEARLRKLITQQFSAR